MIFTFEFFEIESKNCVGEILFHPLSFEDLVGLDSLIDGRETSSDEVFGGFGDLGKFGNYGDRKVRVGIMKV